MGNNVKRFEIEIPLEDVSLSCTQQPSGNIASIFKKRNRRIDQALGRAAAYQALRKLGYEQPPHVPRGERGMPLWPEGVVGSITHSDKFAVAAVAKTECYRCLGIDFQILRPIRADFSRRICNEAETAWVSSPEGLQDQRVLWMFSAKESIFKALYPLVRRYFGFHAVELRPQGHGSFRAVLLEDLSSEYSRGYEFPVSYQLLPEAVFAWTALPPSMS